MPATAHYLQFANLDMEQPEIHARCSACGKEFTSQVLPGEHLDDVLVRVRKAYTEHECGSA